MERRQAGGLAHAPTPRLNPSWVILRPGTLLDAAVPARYVPGWPSHDEIPRDDVAAAVLEIIERPAVNRIIIELAQGKTEVANAVQALART